MRAFAGRLRALTVLTAVATLFGSAVWADHGPTGAVGDFEVDGNFLNDPGGASRDWENVGGVTRIDDPGSDPNDDVLTDGSKENDPDTWKYTTQAAALYPPKTDITRGYFASEVTPSSAFMWLGFERAAADGQGSANMNFEINQKTTSIVNSKGTSIPERTNGDLLVTYDYDGGEKAVRIAVLEWVGTALAGVWQPLNPPPDAAFGDINTASVTRPGGIFGGGSVQKFRFGEAGLDMGVGAFSSFLKCPGLSSFYVKSRASGQTFNSALRDTTRPGTIDFSTCGSITVLKRDDASAPLDGATFEAWRDNGDGLFSTPTDTLAGTCVTGEEGTTGQCTFEQVEPGTYFIREIAAPEGFVLDPTVSQVTVGFRESVTVPHTYVDPKIQYRLSLTPAEDTNLSGNDHEFLAHLEKSLDGGATWSDAAGETIDFTLSGSGQIVSITPSGSIAADTKSGSCVTGGDGRCTATIHSDNPGDSTLTASFDKSTATTPIDLDQNAIKHWVNYRILLAPDGQTNLVGTGHTFTVLLQKTSDGSNWSGVAGATLGISLSGPGSITANSCASPGTASNGECTVTVTSDTPGDTSIQASYNAVEGNTSATFTQSAVKHWVDFRVTVAPDDVNLVGEPHTFTVTVERDSGSGFEPLAGASVSLAWSGPPGSAITGGTCTNGGKTDAAGQCTVVVTSSSPGSGTLTATFDASLNSGPASFGDTGTKAWLDFDLNVTPASAQNDVDQPHVLTVTLRQDGGTGFAGLAGETVDLTLAQGGTDATITNIVSGSIDAGGLTGSCVTDGDGQCLVTVNSSTAGTATLTASSSKAIGSNSLASESDSGSKIWLDADLLKTQCPSGPVQSAAPGQVVAYDLRVTTAGDTLTNATLIDELPDQVEFLSATGGGSYDAASHTVNWSFGSLSAGSDFTVSVSVRILATTPSGTLVTNNATFDADVIAPRTSSSNVLVTTEGAAASGRAFGVRVDVLGGGLILGDPDVPPTPDTDAANPGQLLEIDQGAAGASVNVKVLRVVNSSSATNTEKQDTTVATTSEVTLTLPEVTLSARSVVARSLSRATGFDAGSTRLGSKVQDLVVNGTAHGDVTDPKTIQVRNPLTGALIAEVFVIETVPDAGGAAAGAAQPVDGFFQSGLTVNAIHVKVYDNPLTDLVDESTDVIVGHAEGRAKFPSALACAEEIPSVSGDAFLLEALNLTPPAGYGQVGLVTLGSTGGDDGATVLDTTPHGVVTGNTRTRGSLSPLEAHSVAAYNGANLLGGAVTAVTIEARSDTIGPASSGSTTIEDLDIAGTDVCAALGAGSTCSPAPNTILVLDASNVIVVLNEQITSGGGLRVNAVHIYVIGAGNPLGLPAGAEIFLSSARSDTSS